MKKYDITPRGLMELYVMVKDSEIPISVDMNKEKSGGVYFDISLGDIPRGSGISFSDEYYVRERFNNIPDAKSFLNKYKTMESIKEQNRQSDINKCQEGIDFYIERMERLKNAQG